MLDTKDKAEVFLMKCPSINLESVENTDNSIEYKSFKFDLKMVEGKAIISIDIPSI